VALRRLIPLAFTLALVASVALLPAAGASTATASKKCPKGKRLIVVKKNGKVVKKNGKPVKKCVKKKVTPVPCRTASASCAIPAPPAKGLFEAPGTKLEGEAAKPFLQKYLPNSTFTDCVQGWPACGGFENRYSHATDNTFYKCLLRPTSGSDVKSVGEYGVTNARVEPDGSWIFQETVYWYGYYAQFEWSVSTAGVVNGATASSPGETPEKIGPLQYVGGVAKDCSY
jgi:hypothetical protein